MSSSSSGKRFVLIVLALIIVVIAGFFYLQGSKTPALPAPVRIKANGQPSISNPEATLHFVAFEDLKCSNCRHYNLRLYPQIKHIYIDSQHADYSIVLLSFLPHSTPAANTALCLYKQKPDYFFNFVDYIYAHQPSETEDWATLNQLLQFASQATPNADMNALSQCMETNHYGDRLKENLTLAEKAMNQKVQTPTLFLNGIRVLPLTMKRINEIAAHVS